MKRLLFAAVAALLLGSGMALADDVCFVKVDVSAHTITVKVCDKNPPEEKILDAKRLKLTNAAGKDLKLDDFDKLKEGARLEYKSRNGQITELKISPSKF